jgi:hypothetical protein
MKHIPTPGAYRELFKAGLIELLKGNRLSELQRKDAEHYLRLSGGSRLQIRDSPKRWRVCGLFQKLGRATDLAWRGCITCRIGIAGRDDLKRK